HRWSDGEGRPRIVRQLRPELTGFEMVVASANNAAVENVTTEIPNEEAVDAPWRGNIDYFGDIATTILHETATNDQPNSGKEAATAWGLVAARLGRKKNRSAFHSAFWFDKKDSKTEKPVEDSIPRMQTTLTRWRNGDAPYTPWAQARTAFTTAERRVNALIQQRAQAQERLRRVPQLADRERALGAAIEQELRNLDQIQQDLTR